MTVFLKRDINAAFTNMMNKYLNDGYIVDMFGNTPAHSVDLIKPYDKSHFIRIWLLNTYEHVDIPAFTNKYMSAEVLRLAAVKYNSQDSVCFNVATIAALATECKVFYKYDSIYVDSLEEFNTIYILKDYRIRNNIKDKLKSSVRKIDKKSLTPKFIDGIMKRINNIKGFKRAHADCIDSVEVLRDSSTGKRWARVFTTFNGKKNTIFINS